MWLGSKGTARQRRGPLVKVVDEAPVFYGFTAADRPEESVLAGDAVIANIPPLLSPSPNFKFDSIFPRVSHPCEEEARWPSSVDSRLLDRAFSRFA